MLGQELVAVLGNAYSVYGTVRIRDERPNFYECDITDRNATIKNIERVNPAIVIHAAAMTDVEGCEEDRQKAMRVNFEGTKNVVDGARHVRALMIYISTDFVFSGTRRESYKESHVPHPATAYGESKLLGEFYTRDQSSSFLVIRTSWTYGIHGRNFMTKILSQAANGQELYVVEDQRGSPTYVKDLANAMRQMLDVLEESDAKSALNGIYHVTNSGSASRYQIACELVKQLKFSNIKINPVSSDEFKTLAKRSFNSVLDNSRFQNSFGIVMRPWQEALQDYVKELESSKQLKG